MSETCADFSPISFNCVITCSLIIFERFNCLVSSRCWLISSCRRTDNEFFKESSCKTACVGTVIKNSKKVMKNIFFGISVSYDNGFLLINNVCKGNQSLSF